MRWELEPTLMASPTETTRSPPEDRTGAAADRLPLTRLAHLLLATLLQPVNDTKPMRQRNRP